MLQIQLAVAARIGISDSKSTFFLCRFITAVYMIGEAFRVISLFHGTWLAFERGWYSLITIGKESDAQRSDTSMVDVYLFLFR